jgi:hypothetical protein
MIFILGLKFILVIKDAAILAQQNLSCVKLHVYAIAILNGFTRRRRVKPFTRDKLTCQLLASIFTEI